MKITTKLIMEFGPCSNYPKSRVDKLVGKGKTRLEILDLDAAAYAAALLFYQNNKQSLAALLMQEKRKTTSNKTLESYSKKGEIKQ